MSDPVPPPDADGPRPAPVAKPKLHLKNRVEAPPPPTMDLAKEDSDSTPAAPDVLSRITSYHKPGAPEEKVNLGQRSRHMKTWGALAGLLLLLVPLFILLHLGKSEATKKGSEKMDPWKQAERKLHELVVETKKVDGKPVVIMQEGGMKKEYRVGQGYLVEIDGDTSEYYRFVFKNIGASRVTVTPAGKASFRPSQR